METRSVWRTNRLAMIALVLGILAVVTSPHFFALLENILSPLEGGASYPNKTIWDVYRKVYIWGGFFNGSNVLICWLVSLAGLITGIVSIDRERQKKWIAAMAIVFGIYGIVEHLLGIIMSIMP